MKIFIETQRLILRELAQADDEAMFELDADPEVQTFLGNRPIQHISQAREQISFIRKQYRSNGIGRWAVIEKETGAFAGWSGLKLITEPVNTQTGFYDLGYRFIKRYWGKGYATETAIAALAYGFGNLDLPEIYGMADVNHAASRAVLEKAGLKYLETFEYENRLHDRFRITKADWKKQPLNGYEND